jgi:C1A family cysteine protease
MRNTRARYGWIPDLPDQRDFLYAAPMAVLRRLPARVDLRTRCPPVYDQGALGSCTANAIGAAHQFEQLRAAAARAFPPSRLFIYYNERVIENTVREDAGATLRDGMKTVVKQGVCPEKQWPYVVRRFAERPPKPCYDEALNHQVLSYRRLVQTPNQMKGCLADGYPFVFGFTVYESFESAAVARTGIVPLPQSGERALGGHAVMAVGYDDRRRRFIVRNSWGARWGKAGHCFLPYAYLTDADLAADFWTIRLVEIPPARARGNA